MATVRAISAIETFTMTPESPNQVGSTVTNTHAYTLKNSTCITLLMATSPAANSVSPFASPFHTITIAMHGAMPMMMRPVMYSG